MIKIDRTNTLFIATEVAFDQANDSPGVIYDVMYNMIYDVMYGV